MPIKTCYKNILETGTVSLTAGTADTAYPLYRIYDRNIGRVFKTTSAVTTEVKVDQGASGNLAIDRLLIPSGHNLNGMTLDILYSDNDTDYYPAVTQWVQSGSGLIDKAWTSISKRYWRFKITTPASIPQITELFLSPTYEFERGDDRPGGPFDPIFNIERDESFGGQVRFLIKGDPRKQRVYRFEVVKETQKTNMSTLNDAWAGSKPFYLYDHEGIWIFGEMRTPLGLKEIGYQVYSFEFDFLEVLP